MKGSFHSVETARHYMDQSRYAEAGVELRRALSQDPGNDDAHAMLAICLLELGKRGEALKEAKTALNLAPDNDFAHYVLGFVYYRSGKLKLADQMAESAVRLDPDNSDYQLLIGYILAARGRWKQALELTEIVLRNDPDHVPSFNLRSQALAILGKHDDARKAVLDALRTSPEDADAHVRLGNQYLRDGRVQDAIIAFREALRLEPNLDGARTGLVDALRSRFFLYRWYLNAVLFLQRLPPGARTATLLGIYAMARLGRVLADTAPALLPVAIVCGIVYGLFMFFTFFAGPMLNLWLRFHPLGRAALTRQETRESNWIAFFLVTGLAFPLFALAHRQADIAAGGLMSGLGIMLVGLGAKLNTPRARFWTVTIVGTICALIVAVALWFAAVGPPTKPG